MRILIVEDSEEYQKIIRRTLGDYELTSTGTAEEASTLIRNSPFDMILVDINLPEKDGYFLLGEIQSNSDLIDVPVLCLSGRKEITDKVAAFSLGADDFVTKPFDPIELRARVESKIKKTGLRRKKDLRKTVGEIEIDLARHRVMIHQGDHQEEIHLTQTEFKILCCLARRPEQVYTRDQLLVAAWGEDAAILDRVVDAHICLLRKKLGSRGSYIKSVMGIGYKLVPQNSRKKAV